jgi:hypothetical protein
VSSAFQTWRQSCKDNVQAAISRVAGLTSISSTICPLHYVVHIARNYVSELLQPCMSTSMLKVIATNCSHLVRALIHHMVTSTSSVVLHQLDVSAAVLHAEF